MIKSLLGADEPTENEKTKPDDNADTSLTAPFQKVEGVETPNVTNSETVEMEVKDNVVTRKVEPFEIGEPIGKPKLSEDVESEVQEQQPDIEHELLEISAPIVIDDTGKMDHDGSKGEESPKDVEKVNVLPKAFTPDTFDETIRKTGLASSAAIVLFASVAFMMLFGWFADFAFGTAPWGIVVGIVIGAVIGFVQFFRTTSQILRPPKSEINKIPIYSRADDDKTE